MRVEWSADEVIGSWTLVDEDWRLVANKSGATRLGFALLLKFFELEARFPAGPEELPPAAVSYVAGQVKVDPAELAVYRWTGRTVEYYRAQIRDAFGFREFARGDHDKLAEWLAEEVCPVELRDEQLREALAVRCRAERLEPPGQPDRIIGTARALFEKTFCERITVRLGDDGAARLEALVTAPGSSAGGSGRGLLAELKADPGQVSLETLLREVDKLAGVKALRLPGGCSRIVRSGWWRRGGLARRVRTRRIWRRPRRQCG